MGEGVLRGTITEGEMNFGNVEIRFNDDVYGTIIRVNDKRIDDVATNITITQRAGEHPKLFMTLIKIK